MEPFTNSANRGRLRAIWQEHPWIADLVLAVLIAVIGAISRPPQAFATPELVAYIVVVCGCSIALIFRRRCPRLIMAVIGVLLVVHLVAVQAITMFTCAVCLVAAYTTQTQLLPPWRWGYVVAIYIGTGTAVLGSQIPSSETDWTIKAVLATSAAALITVAVLAGIVRRTQKIRYEDALKRAAVLEARQAVERRLAVIEERARIAREMHDMLGHSLNAIAMQAEGARYVIRTDPDRTDRVLANIGLLSRTAVDDVRDLISVLATDDDSTSAPVLPTPTLRDVGALINDLRYTGATVRLQVDGDLSSVPDHVGFAGYRIIQESLTNVLKHADGAPSSVRIHVLDRTVELSIVNASTGDFPSASDNDLHLGIIGMRERARALGGTLTAGPDPDTGRWCVAVSLPWRQP